MKTKTLLMTALGSGLLFAGSASAQDTGSEMPAPEASEAPEGETPAFDPTSPPAPTIDTDGDGTMDAWDQRGDGKPDTWDTTGDGIPDAFDGDADGEPDPAPEPPATTEPSAEEETPEAETDDPQY